MDVTTIWSTGKPGDDVLYEATVYYADGGQRFAYGLADVMLDWLDEHQVGAMFGPVNSDNASWKLTYDNDKITAVEVTRIGRLD